MATAKKVAPKKPEPAIDYSEFEAIADQPDYSEFEAIADEPSLLENVARDTIGAFGTVGRGGLSALQYLAEKKEEYLDAPTRTVISDTLEGAPGRGLIAGFKQIGDDPRKAPSGAKIARQLGVTSEVPLVNPEGTIGKTLTEYNLPLPTPNNLAGLGIELVADPMLFAKPVTGTLKAAAGATKGLINIGAKAGDFVIGGKGVSNFVNTTGKVVKSSIGSGFSPKKAEFAPKMIKVAESIGIPEKELSASAKYGPESLIAQTEQSVMQSPAGKDVLASFQKTKAKITSEIYKKVDEIAPPVSKLEAGEVVRIAVKDAQDKLMKDISGATMKQASRKTPLESMTIPQVKEPGLLRSLFNKVTGNTKPKELPKKPFLALDPETTAPLTYAINDAKKVVEDASKFATDTIQFKEAMELNRAIKSIDKIKTYDDAVMAMQSIGKTAFESIPKATRLGMVTAPKDKIMDLYFGLQQSIIGTIRNKISPELADEIVKNNLLVTNFLKDRDLFKGILENPKIDGEAVFAKLVGPGKSNYVRALKNILPDKTFKELTSTYLNSLLKKNADGQLLYGSTLKNIESKRDFILTLMPEKELNSLTDLLELGARQGAEKLNTSGTQISQMINSGLSGLLTAGKTRVGYEYLKNRAAKEGIKKEIPLVGKNGYIGPQNPNRFEKVLKGTGLLNKAEQAQREREQ